MIKKPGKELIKKLDEVQLATPSTIIDRLRI